MALNPPEASRCLLQLEADLPEEREQAVLGAVRQLRGVESVRRIENIDPCTETLYEAKKKVAVLLPVLERSRNVAPLLASLYSSTEEAQIYFLANEEDREAVAAIHTAGSPLLLCSGTSWAHKINQGLLRTKEPWVLTGADDLRFTPGWLKKAGNLLDNYEGVIETGDLGSPRVMSRDHVTSMLVSRRYAEERGSLDGPGRIAHEGYFHSYVDDEIVATAKRRRRFLSLSESAGEYLHSLDGKGSDDATYRKRSAGHDHDAELWMRRRARIAAIKPRIVIYSALFGSDVEYPDRDYSTDAFLFSDRHVNTTCVVNLVEAPRFKNARRSAKWYRMHPHLLFPWYDISLWLDASLHVDLLSIAEEILAHHGPDGFTLFAHPERTTIEAEKEESKNYAKYHGEPMQEQVDFYREKGFQDDRGLYATGCMMRDIHSPLLKRLNERWFEENQRWSYQDQLSLPYLFAEMGVCPSILPYGLWQNPLFHFVPQLFPG